MAYPITRYGWPFIKVDLAKVGANLNGLSPFLIWIIFLYINIFISHNSWCRGEEGKTLYKEMGEGLVYFMHKQQQQQKPNTLQHAVWHI